MPSSLPSRSGGHRDYDKDCPITVFGSTQARLVGLFFFSLYLYLSITFSLTTAHELLKNAFKEVNE